jgi:cytoskeletal protein CcmA (bactofilin family)
MWKKGDEQIGSPTSPSQPAPSPTSSSPSRPPGKSSDRATIGRSITIRGDVSGDEDLMIQGRIEGSIELAQHSVTIGPEGRVKANISARSVTVEGEVTGNLKGQEQVALRATAQVQGDIVSPRVILDDGATFRGSIDMSAPPKSGGGAATPAPSNHTPRQESSQAAPPKADRDGAAKA